MPRSRQFQREIAIAAAHLQYFSPWTGDHGFDKVTGIERTELNDGGQAPLRPSLCAAGVKRFQRISHIGDHVSSPFLPAISARWRCRCKQVADSPARLNQPRCSSREAGSSSLSCSRSRKSLGLVSSLLSSLSFKRFHIAR